MSGPLLTLPGPHAIVGGPEPRPARGGVLMKCPRCQQESPADADFCPECGEAGGVWVSPRARQRPDLEHGSGLVPLVSRSAQRF